MHQDHDPGRFWSRLILDVCGAVASRNAVIIAWVMAACQALEGSVLQGSFAAAAADCVCVIRKPDGATIAPVPWELKGLRRNTEIGVFSTLLSVARRRSSR